MPRPLGAAVLVDEGIEVATDEVNVAEEAAAAIGETCLAVLAAALPGASRRWGRASA